MKHKFGMYTGKRPDGSPIYIDVEYYDTNREYTINVYENGKVYHGSGYAEGASDKPVVNSVTIDPEELTIRAGGTGGAEFKVNYTGEYDIGPSINLIEKSDEGLSGNIQYRLDEDGVISVTVSEEATGSETLNIIASSDAANAGQVVGTFTVHVTAV